MRKRRKSKERHLREHEELTLGIVPPDKAVLDRNLSKVSAALGIDEEDYKKIDTQELALRIKARIQEQDNTIYPQRLSEERVTPEWRRYIQKRVSSEGA